MTGDRKVWGEFAACGVNIGSEDLRDYLHAARIVSADYYVDMLADELLDKLEQR